MLGNSIIFLFSFFQKMNYFICRLHSLAVIAVITLMVNQYLQVVRGCSNNSSVYILSATENILKENLIPLKSNIDLIASNFCNYQLLIYADTKSYQIISDEWGKNSTNMHLHLLKEVGNPNNMKTIRLAVARNALIQKVKELVSVDGKFNTNIDNIYTAMMDMDDGTIKQINNKSFEKVMNQTDQWDSVSFHLPHYNDIWALRYKRYNINPYAYKGDTQLGEIIPWIRKDIIKQLQETKQNYYHVYSAYNGLAIYKYKYTLGCTYNGTSAEYGFPYDSEHVFFHRCMTSTHQAKIMIYVGSMFEGPGQMQGSASHPHPPHAHPQHIGNGNNGNSGNSGSENGMNINHNKQGINQNREKSGSSRNQLLQKIKNQKIAMEKNKGGLKGAIKEAGKM